jgi:glycosyltransferase involved in cell wall biosynthesis
MVNFTKQKRPDRFIDIINSVKSSIPNIHGLMVGDGGLRSAVYDQISTFSLENNITCVGYKKDVRPWIAMSDVLLLTSDTEGMPGVVLEAAAMKKITITGNVGGVAEFIESHVNGIIVDWGQMDATIDVIIQIIKDSYKLEFYGEMACEFVNKNFYIEFIFERYKTFFQKLLYNSSFNIEE